MADYTGVADAVRAAARGDLPKYEEAVQTAVNHLRAAEALDKEMRHEPKSGFPYFERIHVEAHLSRGWSALAMALPPEPIITTEEKP